MTKYVLDNVKDILKSTNNTFNEFHNGLEFNIIEDNYKFSLSCILDFENMNFSYKLNLTEDQYMKAFSEKYIAYFTDTDENNFYEEFMNDYINCTTTDITDFLQDIFYTIQILNNWSDTKLNESFLDTGYKMMNLYNDYSEKVIENSNNTFIDILIIHNIGFGCNLYSKCNIDTTDMIVDINHPRKQLYFYSDAVSRGSLGCTDATVLISYPNNVELLENAYNEVKNLAVSTIEQSLFLKSLEKLLNDQDLYFTE